MTSVAQIRTHRSALLNKTAIVGGVLAATLAASPGTAWAQTKTYTNGQIELTPLNITTSTQQLEVAGADAATQRGVISETAGPLGFEKIGTGTLTLAATNTYSGVTVISAGTLIVGSSFYGVAPSATLGSDSATNIVRLNGGTLQIDNQVATFARPVEITASNGTINNVAGLTLNGVTTFTGLLSKTGAGTLILNGAGTGAGGLSILAGGLQVGNAAALGTGTLRMAGNTSLVASPSNVSVANAIVLDGTISVVTNNNTLSLTGAISGVGRLDKNNGGTLNLSGDSNFAGGFGLNAGTLGIGSNTAVGVGQLSVATGSTVVALGNVTLANAIRLNPSAGFGTANPIFDTGANTLTLNGVISGQAVGIEQTPYGITKNGSGTLVLNGANTYSGATVVNAGKLVVGGAGTSGASIASSSSLTIAAGATIGGNGATPTLTVNGTISPGNSVGTLNINGGLILGAGSTTVIEIEGATADRVNVAGTAALNGTLQLVAAGGTYAFATPYTILTSTGARTGAFATVNTTGSFGVGVTSAVAYGANNVQVTLTAAPLVATGAGSSTVSGPILGLSQTRNITAVAFGLDRAALAGADLSPLFAVYNQPTREALAAAVNALSGEVHTATTAIGYRASDQFLRVMLDPYAIGRDGALVGTSGPASFTADLPGRKGPVEAPRPIRIEPSFSVWAATFGATGRADGNRRIVGSAERDLKDANIAVGADYRIAAGTAVGFALSGGRAEAKLAGNMGSSEADIFQAGLYGASQIGALRLGASASYGSLQVQTRRQIAVLGQSVTADYRADMLGGRLQAAYEVFTANGFSLSPFAALQIQSVHTPNFRETSSLTGAGAGVNGISRTNTALRSEFGVKAATVAQFGGRRLTLFGELGWGHDFLRDMTFAASLSPVPGASFVVAGARQERDAALVAAGADYQIAPNMTLSGRFDGTLAANSRTYAGNAALRLSF
ncbi:autotransporter domain-containing protein [Bosea sp. 685]|uniref:autotransporter outer membrane beta-barrel domain-containing protein n=1 Tax=Bosea sp. 685 TaxID=3080057 RepID=UPI002892A59C|nr:autotransporter domain-containing protein [Bosea sp. 685]WNJ89690.1 autotransporter domain-containing protein [Bosea sp. 685]